jgi:hypothetical protein
MMEGGRPKSAHQALVSGWVMITREGWADLCGGLCGIAGLLRGLTLGISQLVALAAYGLLFW